MKKSILALSLIIFMVAGAVSVSAQNYWNSDVLSYDVTYGTVNIDGKAESGEWDDAPAISVKLLNDPLAEKGVVNYQGEWEDESSRSDSDYQGTYKVKWDENYIYYFEERIDDHVNLSGNGSEPWNTDGVLVFTQVDDGASMNPDGISHHIFYSVGKDDKIGGDVMVRIANTEDASRETIEIEGAKIAAALTTQGYIVEIAVPWSMYKKDVANFSNPKAGDTMGITYVIADSDTDESGFVKQLCYAVDNDNLGDVPGGYDFGGWGMMTLAAPVVVEEQLAETEAPATEDQPEVQEVQAVEAPVAPQTSDNAILFILIALAAISGGALTIRKIKVN